MTADEQHYLGHRQRLRERILKNPQEAEAYELLELLLGYVHKRSDTKPLAKELLKHFGSVWDVLNAHPTELETIKGFGESSKIFFILLREIVARYFIEPIKDKKSVTLDEIAMLARCRLDGLCHEEIWVALLDNNNRLLSFDKVHAGTMDAAFCSPKMIAEIAITKKATALILIHNHPGGVTKASWADRETTLHIQKVMNLMGIRFLDHLIIADGKVISLANNHLLDENEIIFNDNDKSIV